ncbi:MAG: OmpA family protein [Ferruginibacter sp.]|nr:OmpA family protein [Ferruginibacter sp.]
MKTSTCLLAGFISFIIFQNTGYAQTKTISADNEWKAHSAFLQNTAEADYIIRVGDIDNLGFGWPDGFDPFCGRTTDAHAYPWKAGKEDLPGFDRILLSSKFTAGKNMPCGGDGYSLAYNAITSKPVTYSLATDKLKNVSIKNVFLQVFIDDFQAPSLCSKYQVTLNGIRFVEFDKILNAIDQTGPVGKLVTVPVPEEFYTAITSKATLAVKIDETTGAADGFAIDFIRLLINRNLENTCKGSVSGIVLDKATEQPVVNASIIMADKTSTKTNREGRFSFRNIPTGFEVLTAAAPGYNDGRSTADIGSGEDNPEVTIYLEKGAQAVFDKREVSVGEVLNLDNILFDQAKWEIKKETKPALDNVVEFLNTNADAEIELSGHTSSEGDAAYNRSLSYKRVKACKDYIILKGIDPGRIIVYGYGPDRPIESNDTEENRAKNRRVEMRIVKL